MSALLLGGSVALAQLRVMDESAISYTSFLSKADFDARFPGELLQDSAELEAGWYVIYTHAALNYYFGPVSHESLGRYYERQLAGVVSEAVDARPDLQGYRIELRQAPFESSAVEPMEEVVEAEPSEAIESSETEETEDATGSPQQPQESTGLWGWVKKVFGF